jgi:Glycosyl transferase family 11
MIAVRLMGGLGNQMFQYAAGRRLADVLDVPLVLDLSRLRDRPPGETPREFGLDCFRIRAELSESRIETTRLKPRWLRRPSRPFLVTEKGFPVNDRVLRARDDTLLVGYWQSETYFADDADAIRHDFTPHSPLSAPKQALADQIDDCTVAVQLRRTDYVTHSGAAETIGVLPLTYYERAAAQIAEEIRTPRFLVISDDPVWCRENLNLGHPTTVVDRTPAGDHEDMILISMCRRVVIANSSFGWWGAWLSRAPEKVVIAPGRWFADTSIDARDLIPEGWITL